MSILTFQQFIDQPERRKQRTPHRLKGKPLAHSQWLPRL
jgi:hypothetical protein